MSDFYLSLPSKGSISMATFPNNTQANFTTLLPKNVNLNGLYKVGLAEISYTNSIAVNAGFITIKQDFIFESFNLPFGTQQIEIVSEDCLSLEFFISKINSEITRYFKIFYEKNKNKNSEGFDDDRELIMPLIKFVSNDSQVTIDMPIHTSLSFDEYLKEILKFDFNILENKTDKPYKKSIQIYGKPSIHLCDTFLVYTDIITDQIYGDTLAKIIRNVRPNGENNENITITYDSIHYVDLNVTSLKTVQINIRDNQGNLIHFNDKLGQVVIKLHFKLK